MSSKAHDHFYVQDVRPDREAFTVCSVCGLSLHKRHILTYWAVFDRQLSPEMLLERKLAKVSQELERQARVAARMQ